MRAGSPSRRGGAGVGAALLASLVNAVSPAATATSLRVVSQVAAAIAGGAAIVAPRSAFAACTPGDTGTAGADVITCDAANPPATNVNGLGGDDTITIDGVTAVFGILGGDGLDTIDLINGAGVASISGGNDVDTINLTNGTVGSVDWGAGNESGVLDLINVTLGGQLTFGLGADNFTLNAGTVGTHILLGNNTTGSGTDADTFTMAGGTVNGLIYGDSGADTINLNGGTVTSEVRALNGANVITLNGATVGAITGGNDVDVINLDSGTATTVNWGAGDETYTLDLTNVALSGNVFMGQGADDFTFIAGTVGFDVYLGSGNNNDSAGNIFTLNGGAITRRIWGGNFADTINLNSGTIGQTVYANSGADTVNLVGTATVGGINGGADVDLINLTSGTVFTVDWGAGDETYTLDLTNVTLGGNIHMGLGADNFTHSAGHVGGIVYLASSAGAGTDADTFTLAGGTVGSRIEGGGGIDTINLNAGSSGQVRGFNGNDVITLDGTANIASIWGGADVDTINLMSGTVNGNVDWSLGDESQTLDLTNVNLTGSLIFGYGSDDFTLSAGTVGQYVYLGAGANNGTDADTFTMNGGTIGIRIEGDQGADTLNLNGGNVISGTGVRTFTGADVINLDGTILHGGIDAGGDSDTINLISGGVTTVNAGAGDDTGVLDLTNITLGNTATPGMGQLTMGTGSDNFTLNAGVINGSVILGSSANAGNDADTFTMNGGTITSRIEGDQGDDTINLNGGTVQNTAQAFRGFAGNDTINLDGAMLVGGLDAGADDDTFNWSSGTLGGSFVGNTGNDAANISAATYDGTTVLDGGQFNAYNQVTGDNGTPLDPTDDPFITITDTFTDTLTFNGANTGVSANTIRGWESVNLVNATLNFDTLMLNGVNAINDNNVATALNVTGGDVTLSGASVLTDLLGSASNETLTVTGTTVASNNVEGAGGADTISITGDASVTGGVFGGAAGHDASAAADGGDTITINTTGSVGSIDGGLGDDAINLTAGTVNTNVLGGDGNDTITIFDGFTVTSLIDGGANTAAGDTIAVDTAATRTFDASNLTNFEVLQKDNTGVLTLTGAQGFSGGTVINGGTLDVDGPTQAAITGSAGVNTVNVTGTLRATADLGDGADVLDVTGTLDAGTGTFALGLGDDTFTIHDGTTVIGTVDGGAGTDVFNTNIATTASVGATLGFETLLKTGAGLLNLTGPAASSFDTINVNAGTVDADGAINGVSAASVLAGAIFNVDGPLSFTTGADTLTVAGTISGTSTIDLGAGNDTFTFQEGAVTSVPVDGGAGTDTLNANILTTGTLAQAANFETLTKTGAGVLNITGPGVSDFSTVNVNDGTLDIAAAGSFANVNAATVASGATLDADGAFDFTTGADNFDIAGAVTGAGTFDMLGGDDTLTLRDGADLSGLANAIDGNAGSDTIVANVAGLNTVILDGSQIDNFERLQKDGGLAFQSQVRLTGAETFSGGIDINAGTVDVHGAIGAPTVSFNSGAGTFLVVSNGGVLDDGASGHAGITGTLGVQTVGVLAGGVLRATADLGDGADVLDVAGTLDTGSGTFALGAGNDFFTIHDGTSIIGIVDGGAGTDIFNPNITTMASLGAAQGFETLTKTGVGVLNVTGPGVSDFSTVNVNAGTLDLAAAGSITTVNAATVASGATLDADGAFGFTTGGDTFDISGTVSGAGTFDMLAGDDTLTLRDGADLSGLTASIDGNAGSDTVVVDNATALTFSGTQVTNFETLQKDNTGVLTLAGTQSYSVATTINGGTLDVDDTLETPTVAMADATTLNVDGTVQAAGPTQAAITGSTGMNTINVNAGATLFATGDLGDGADILDVAGTLDTGAGTFFLGAGDDTFIVHDTTVVIGALDAGLGNDTLNVNVSASNLVPLGATTGFESLAKSGLGGLQINGPSSFIDVDLQAGLLQVTLPTGSVAAQNTTIAAGATLQLDGAYTGTTGADTFDVAGAVTGAGGVDLLAGDDTLTLREGADLSGLTSAIDGNTGTDTVIVDNATAQTFDGSQVINFETLQKDNTGTLTLTGVQSFSGGTIVNGGALDIDGTYETPTVAMADGSTLNVDGTAQANGPAQAVVTGSSGVNTITVNSGATLLATADLGDGADMLTVAGTLDAGGGTFAMGAGDDVFTINDGATVLGTVDGAAGADTINTNISMAATLGASIGFETLTKTGAGVLNVIGPAASSFDTVDVNAGALDIAAAGSITNVNAATVAEGATLNTDGSFLFTPGSDQFDVAGTLSGAGDLDMLEDDDAMIVHASADISGFTGMIDGGDGIDRVEFHNLDGVLPDTFTNFEEVYLLNDTTADAHMPGDGVRTLDVMLAFVQTDSHFIADGNSPGITNIMGDLVNLGVVTMADGEADDRINVGGDYAGGGGLEIDAALDATATADLLVIEGNVGDVTTTLAGAVASASTLLSVTDVGNGVGVDTGTGPGAGIAVVDVSATGGTVDGDFVLDSPLVAGEYAYDLNLETDGVWYLQSELLEQVSGYSAALPGMIGIMNQAVGLGGDSRTARAGQADYFDREAGAGNCKATDSWMRTRGGRLRETPESGSRLRQRYGQLDFGIGQTLDAGDSGCFKIAARGIVGLADSDAYNLDHQVGAELDTRYHGAGLSMTLRRDNGFYIDFSGQALRFNTDVSVRGEGVKAEIDAWGVSASAETGLRVDLSNNLYITPRVQLNWNGLYGDDFTDADGADISFADNQQFSVTKGIVLEKTSDANWINDSAKLAMYGVFDVQYNTDRDLSIISSGEEFEYIGNEVWTRVGAGATLAINKNISFYGELSGSGALSDSIRESHSVEGNIGFRLRW
ncbi:Adhesin BmaC autotransporter (Brucella monomeric autotransporter) [Durusdinium trenchii]|uniref:Adhesin BmaC autotransporter (Brucella monomeric autotransporter) n=1 Tax=Durusdinium trenchii TaxID=1381693 RepID=A0ABP0LS11_9DINO